MKSPRYYILQKCRKLLDKSLYFISSIISMLVSHLHSLSLSVRARGQKDVKMKNKVMSVLLLIIMRRFSLTDAGDLACAGWQYIS